LRFFREFCFHGDISPAVLKLLNLYRGFGCSSGILVSLAFGVAVGWSAERRS